MQTKPSEITDIIDLLLSIEEVQQETGNTSLRTLVEQRPELADAMRSLNVGLDEVEQQWIAIQRANRRLGGFGAAMPQYPQIAGFVIQDEIGRGGMGVVVRARQARLDRDVAIKLIVGGKLAASRSRQRFHTEAQAIARLQDPNIVQIFDSGEAEGELYIVMELLEGGTLADRLQRGVLPVREAAVLVERLACAIQHAHQQGVVHRDLKPANILFDSSGSPKIGDFGLAKALAEESELTATGDVAGSPSYMAPEQITGQGVNVTTDVYGLGAILYELLTGRPPFLGETTADTLLQVQLRTPVAPRRLRGEVPRDLEAVCLKCLEKDPRRRYSCAAALAADLRRWLDGEATLARPLTPLGVLWRRAAARPVTSAFIATTALAIVAVAIGASLLAAYLNRSLQAVEQREADLRARLYAWDTRQGLDAWTVFSRDQNIEMLNRYVPGSAEADLRSFPWHYWNKLCRSATWEATHHEGQVYGIAYSADGQYLLSGGADGRLCVWDVKSGRLVDERRTDHGEVCSVAITLDGGEIFCGRQDGTVETWEFSEGNLSREPSVFAPGPDREIAVAVSPDGRWIAGAQRDSELVIWSRADGKRVWFSEKHPSHCRTCIFSRDGKMLVATGGNSVYRLDLDRGEWLEEINVEGGIDSFGVSPDGTWLAAVGVEGRVLCLDLETGHWEELWRQGAGTLHEVDFSPDGRYLLAVGDDERLCIYDVAARRLVSQVKGHSGVVWTAGFSPDGETIASCGADKTVRVFRTADLLGAEQIFVSEKSTTCLAFSTDSETLFVGGHEDGSLRLWDTGTWRGRVESQLSANPQHQVQALADDRLLVLQSDGQLSLVDRNQMRSPLPVSLPATVYRIDGHDGSNVVSIVLHGSRPEAPYGACVVYDTVNDEILWQWPFPEGMHYCLFAAHGDSALFVGVSGTVSRATAAGARTLDFTLPPAENGWGGAAWTVDARTLIYVEAKANLTLVDISNGEQHGQLIAHDETITSLACSPDGRILASADAGGTVHLWDLATCEQSGTLQAPGAVRSMKFSPNSRLLAAIIQVDGETKTRAYLWDATDRQRLAGI